MNKKSVSPLIASILLIALTVSIGAMIIGWGRQYVNQRTSCLGMEVTILSATYDSVNSEITSLSAINVGFVAIPANSKLYLVVEDRDGNRETALLTTLGGDWGIGDK
ncbi:archaellin/type IV pilin N-terminal domain-containing protein [Pyrococcus kukulkanii]|uniref:archaellin/type IV pilin N-terminal domain-containing protein n=1 Tax=Pyrococcus kukulkanii TaxID=1609559 RepID=UPI003565297B